MKRPFFLGGLACAVIAIGFGLALQPAVSAPTRADVAYPYGGAAYRGLVAESFQTLKRSNPEQFDVWLADQYKKVDANGRWLTAVDAWKPRLAQGTETQRTQAAMDAAAFLHRSLKRMIPKFSLDRGFEFVYTLENGERQCFLQSILTASLLQRMGLDAGVAMVFRNEKGQPSNCGHAVTIFRRADGRAAVVDLSEAKPFVVHQGLFLRVAGRYRFTSPTYQSDLSITGFTPLGGSAAPVSAADWLDRKFLLSQTHYYRGERAPGGFLANPKTDAGMAESLRFFQLAVRESDQNPLAVYALGWMQWRLGQQDAARATLRRARKLYSDAGWTPSGPTDLFKTALGS